MIFAGIDCGSRTLKVVLLDGNTRRMLAAEVADQTVDQEALAAKLLRRVLARCRLDREALAAVVSTGYGRKLIGWADEAVTEITCQARGVRHLLPEARTVIDIGGQDSKLICLDTYGMVEHFAMNDRCAAGTGRFLEVVATRLEVNLEGLGRLAAASAAPAVISSMCVVFAETEIIGLLASGADRSNIAAGVFHALASRVAALAAGQHVAPVVFTGGVALVPRMRQALEKALDCEVTAATNPQLTCALGAALVASERFGPGRSEDAA